MQIVVAVVVSYSIAHYVLGHATPLIAVTVTITALGIARDARPRRVLDIAVGVTVGILTSELIVLVIGKGPWQLAVVLFATLVVTRAVSPNPAFAVAAAVQSMIVVLLPDPAGGPFTRSIDALVAGLVALAATGLIPRDPRRAASRDGRVLFSVFTESLGGLVDALAHGSLPAAELALERLRRTQELVDNWTTSLDTAVSVARISPWLRRHLPELLVQTRVLASADLASRHLRIIARRIAVVVQDGDAHPELAALMGELRNSVELLGRESVERKSVGRESVERDTVERETRGASRRALTDLARRLDPATITPDGALRETLVVVLVRPLVVDLLVGTGLPADDAKALLPPV